MVPSYEVMSLSSGSQCFAREQQCKCVPDSKVHGVLSGPVGPRWAPCWSHEPCHQGCAVAMVHADEYGQLWQIVIAHFQHKMTMGFERQIKYQLTIRSKEYKFLSRKASFLMDIFLWEVFGVRNQKGMKRSVGCLKMVFGIDFVIDMGFDTFCNDLYFDQMLRYL